MNLTGVELRRLHLPFRTPMRTAYGVEDGRDVLLVRVLAGEAEGWAECAALREPLYSPEYVDGAHDVIRRHLAPRLLGAPAIAAADVAERLGPVRGHRMAKAALETAVLDAELQLAGESLGHRLGAVRDRVPAGATIGVTAPAGKLLEAVAAAVEAGYVRVKLKIERGWDVEPVAAVRARFGDGLALQVDANGAYTVDDAAHLGRLDEFGLLLIEQPLPPGDLAGHARLAASLATPVCLDESITSAAAAAHAIEVGACAVVNVKPGRVGGYLEAARVHDVCIAAGVPVWCGGMYETGVGRAGNLALAALPGFTLPGDLSASDRYFRRDVTAPCRLDGGHLAVPQGPGIGGAPDPGALAELTATLEYLRP